jgi:hypothetical protein
MTRTFERKDNDRACTEDSDFRQCTYWYLRLEGLTNVSRRQVDLPG